MTHLKSVVAVSLSFVAAAGCVSKSADNAQKPSPSTTPVASNRIAQEVPGDIKVEGPNGEVFFKRILFGYPVGEGCGKITADLSARFAAQSGRRVISVSCEEDSSDSRFDVAITYDGPSRVEGFSTSRSFGAEYAAIGDGVFETPEACDKELPSLVEEFKTHTGKEPLAAYCHGDTYFDARIDGVGIPAMWPFAAGFSVGNPSDDSVLTAMQAAGFQGVKRYKSLYRGYAREYPFLDNVGVGTHNLDDLEYLTLAECEESRDQLQSAYEKVGFKVLNVYCATYGSTFEAGVIVYGGTYSYLSYEVEQFYQNLADCRADTSRVEGLYAQQSGTRVYSSVCEGGAKSTKMHLLIEKK